MERPTTALRPNENTVKRLRTKLAQAIVTVGAIGLGTVAMASDGGSRNDKTLSGFQEVPALSPPGVGQFRALRSRSRDEIRYRLTFQDLESSATQAHIQFRERDQQRRHRGVSLFELGERAAGTQACPGGGGTIKGTIRRSGQSTLAQERGRRA